MKRLFRKQRTTSYDPFTYWNSRSNPNNTEGTDAARVAFDTGYIASAVSHLDPVLELGPGVGRTLGAYARGRNITALDLSRAYTDKLLLRASELGLTLTPLYLSSPMDPFPLADKRFPVGVASQVLMHIPPESSPIPCLSWCGCASGSSLFQLISTVHQPLVTPLRMSSITIISVWRPTWVAPCMR